MPVKWSAENLGHTVDWGAVYDKTAGIFNYGFRATDDGVPHAFYMKGVPWIAQWMWQLFANFTTHKPPTSTWEVPAACKTAKACPGWAPQL